MAWTDVLLYAGRFIDAGRIPCYKKPLFRMHKTVRIVCSAHRTIMFRFCVNHKRLYCLLVLELHCLCVFSTSVAFIWTTKLQSAPGCDQLNRNILIKKELWCSCVAVEQDVIISGCDFAAVTIWGQQLLQNAFRGFLLCYFTNKEVCCTTVWRQLW